MSYAGYVKLEILDLGNTSGAPTLSYAYCQGGMVPQSGIVPPGLFVKFRPSFRNSNEIYSVPTVVRGLGGESLSGTGITGGSFVIGDPLLRAEFRGQSGQVFITGNDNWNDLSYAGTLTNYNLLPVGSLEATFQAGVGDADQYIWLTGKSGSVSDYYKRARIDIIRVYNDDFKEIQTQRSGTDKAWLTYDMSGTNNNQVFAYSMEILKSISGTEQTPVQVVGEYYKASELTFYSGANFSGACDQVSFFLDNTGASCSTTLIEDTIRALDTEICVPTGLTPQQVQLTIQRGLASTLDTLRKQGTTEGDFVDDSSIVSNSVSLNYSIYRGEIAFNQPYPGDYIEVSPYSYDYTGEYQERYGVNPPYPEPIFHWVYGTHYTNRVGLMNLINNLLSGQKYNLWLKDVVCANDSASGYYESGGILKATLTGDNGIAIESLRTGPVGKYQFTFYETDRPVTGIEIENKVKYLLPNKITLQGANTYGNWTTLNVQSGIRWDLIRPTEIVNVFYEEFTGTYSGAPRDPTPAPDVDIGATGHVVTRVLYEATVSGADKCGTYFEHDIKFIEVPSGFDCSAVDSTDNFSAENNTNELELTITGTENAVVYEVLKTGWKFNNTGSYNYYRLYLEEFVADNRASNLAITNSFVINNINFFGVETGYQVHTGSVCILGANYTGKIQGYAVGTISGTLTGLANGSGYICFDHQIVTGTPNYDGSIFFNKSGGKAIEPFTGVVTACLSGTGFYSDTVYGYYYNSGNQCIEYSKPVSGIISGSGYLTGGPYPIIFDSVLDNVTGFQYVTGSTIDLLTGLIPNNPVTFEDIEAFTYAAGTITGTVTSGDLGSLDIDQLLLTAPLTAYTLFTSGHKQAECTLLYNTPTNQDRVTINGFPIFYNSDTGLTPPTYFKTIDELTNIINSGTSSFGMTAVHDATRLYLTANAFGESGNNIPISTTGSATKPVFDTPATTGGVNYYYPVIPTTVFTGQLTTGLLATSSFRTTGYGYLTGRIKQLDFIRYFTGIWDIVSGDNDFQLSGWVTAGGSKYQNSGFVALDTLSGRPDVIPLLISYTNNPLVYSKDFAKLIVTGYDSNTGIVMILSGQL